MSEQPSYHRYWGKADFSRTDDPKWHPLVYHCLDVAAVGKTLLEKSDLLRLRFSESLHLQEQITIRFLTFILAIHDIGKFADVFQNKRSDLYEMLQGRQCEKSSDLRHDSLGYIAWKFLWPRLSQESVFAIDINHHLSWDIKNCFDQLAICFTGHHGLPATDRSGTHKYSVHSFFSTENIEDIFQFIKDQWHFSELSFEDIEECLTDEDLILKASWWISGLLVLCDWMGSDQTIFTYEKASRTIDDYWHRVALARAQKALDQCGVLPKLTASPVTLTELVEAPIIPSPLQLFFENLEIDPKPQLWILEDITGSGKTEAAFLLASRLMHAGQGAGLYIGLPTMATADGMYARMAEYYRHLYMPGQIPSLILAHGSRHLSERFRNSIIEIDISRTRDDKGELSSEVQCVKWLADNRKKALLADIGVGTIDQALLSILPSRHQALRLCGLGTKLLVVDEVHAYDTYMHALLKALLEFHAGFGGSVVLLSATLPQQMREELIRAFQKGIGANIRPAPSDSAYPMVTKVTGHGIDQYPIDASPRSRRTVPVQLIHNEQTAVEKIIETHKNGQCACWIRNTVEDTRRAVEILSKEKDIAPSSILLFHARFTLADRLEIERFVTQSFGKRSMGADRKGKILIATQVVEMSLDLDFDCLISDLSPMDSVIQRAGRMHRHVRDSQGNLRSDTQLEDQRTPAVMQVLSPELVESPGADWYADFFPKATMVYPHVGQLWLTACLLNEKGRIKMPDELRALIEGVYATPIEQMPDVFEDASKKAQGEAMGRSGLGRYNALNYESGYRIDSGQWSEEIHVPTRVGDETHTVYLAHQKESCWVPINEGYAPWDMSSVKVSKRKLSKLSDQMHQQYTQELDTLIRNEKRLSAYDLVLPMERTGDAQWISEGEDGKGNTVEIKYDRTMGLMIGDEIKGG